MLDSKLQMKTDVNTECADCEQKHEATLMISFPDALTKSRDILPERILCMHCSGRRHQKLGKANWVIVELHPELRGDSMSENLPKHRNRFASISQNGTQDEN
jgi:hypothetical protein